MRTGLLNRAGDVRIPVEVNPATRQQRHAREKDRHRDEKWAPRLAAVGAFSRTQRTADQRKSMALFGMFRWRAQTHGWRRRELQGRENTYGQKFGSATCPFSNGFSLGVPRCGRHSPPPNATQSHGREPGRNLSRSNGNNVQTRDQLKVPDIGCSHPITELQRTHPDQQIR